MPSNNIYDQNPDSSKKYVVYITHYLGDKMPQNYIGSTTIQKIYSGYKGSIKSKKYRQIWNEELDQNPHLFSIEIISYHDTRPEALYKELLLHQMFNIVNNPIFVNQAYASVNGYFGVIVTGKDNPWYGKKHTEESRKKMSKSSSGEQSHRFGKTGENNTLSISFWAVDPDGVKHIVKGIAQFARLHNLSASSIINVLKGKGSQHKNWTFGYIEEFRQPLIEKIEKKTKRPNGGNCPNLDCSIYIFFNTKTQEIFEGHRFDFIKAYNLKSGGVSGVINTKQKTHRKWILLEKISETAIKNFQGKPYEELYGKEKSEYLKQLISENLKTIDRAGKKHPRYDFSIYKFLNTDTKEIFEGERFDFIKTYNLKSEGVSTIINGKQKTHHNWIFLEKIS